MRRHDGQESGSVTGYDGPAFGGAAGDKNTPEEKALVLVAKMRAQAQDMNQVRGLKSPHSVDAMVMYACALWTMLL